MGKHVTQPFASSSTSTSASTTASNTPTLRRSLSDPFDKVLQPPRNESPEAREARLVNEQKAKQRSDDIDEQLRKDRATMKKQRQAIKILLLGQSESGKSTTLKRTWYKSFL